MLFADDLALPLTLVERYGSFGLVCLIVIGGIIGIIQFLRTLRNDLIPRAFAYLEKKDADTAAYLKERDAVCKMAAETAAKAAEQVERMTEAVADLVTEVKRLKDRTDDHPPAPRARGKRGDE